MGSPLCPVVGVSWFEAEAYCRWLALEVGMDPGNPTAPRLPAEAEWGRAVRGTGGLEYPWGDVWDRGRLNCVEWWAGRGFSSGDEWKKWVGSDERKEINPTSTAVLTFPDGANPAGVWDGAGNVWEWTGSGYVDGKSRIVRGGSWDGNRGSARCAARSGFDPDGFSDSLGFRVVFPGAS